MYLHSTALACASAFSARSNVCGAARSLGSGPTAVHSRRIQGLEPVGNGQAAAGFSAVLAPGVAAVEGAGAAVAGACGAAIGVARCGRFRPPAFLRADPFRAAAFLPAAFLPARLTGLAAAFRPAVLFFFFVAFFAFFALFLAMTDLHQR